MNNNETLQEDKKKPSHRKYILAAGLILLLIIAALAFIWFTQEEPKPDPASEKMIRQIIAANLHKDPNELTDDDFLQIKALQIYDYNSKMVTNPQLSDIKLLEKFTNLESLNITGTRYPDSAIPKWMKYFAKLGVFDLEEKFAIDLSPIQNLTALKSLRLSHSQISDITPLKGLVNLETLFIDYTRVSDLEPLMGLANLQTLSISETPVFSLEPIKQLKKLRRLIMINCPNITDEQLKDLRIACPGLIVINDYVE